MWSLGKWGLLNVGHCCLAGYLGWLGLVWLLQCVFVVMRHEPRLAAAHILSSSPSPCHTICPGPLLLAFVNVNNLICLVGVIFVINKELGDSSVGRQARVSLPVYISVCGRQ